MKKSLLLFLLALPFIALAQPANDVCSGAISLGTLPNPGACGSGVQSGTTTTIAGTNVGSTPENPYVTLTGCGMASPANSVWYSFVAPTRGYGVNLSIGGASFNQPNIALWTGNCNNLTGIGCNVGSGGNVTLNIPSGIVPGQTYYIQVSGNTGQSGTFNLSANAFQDCNDCLNASSLTVTPLPTNGSYLPGTNVTFCYHIDRYTQVSTNWLHGVQLAFGTGWDMTTLTTNPPNSIGNCGDWDYYSSGITDNGGQNWPAGFYFDGNCAAGPNSNDGNPGNNFGDSNNGLNGAIITPTANQWRFCWTVRVKSGCNPGQSLAVTVNTSGDGESGSWTSAGCSSDPPTNFNAIIACCPPTLTFTPVSCPGGTNGTATATPVGSAGPYSYSWSGPSGYSNTSSNVNGANTITGIAAGTYTVTITDANLCASSATIIVTTTGTIPTANAGADIPVCSGTAGNLGTTSTAGYTYNWNPSTGLSSTTISNPTVSLTNGTSSATTSTYTVTVTGAGGCTATDAVVVTVNPRPIASFSPVINKCLTGNSTNFTNTTSPSGALTTYTWNFPGATPSSSTATNPSNVTWAAAGTYTITLTAAQSGCSSTYTQNITIHPMPVVTTSSTNVLCNGGTTGTATATGGGTYSWNTTPSQTTATATGLAAGTYTVSVTSVNTCVTVGTAIVTQPPALTATQSQVNVLCNGATTGSATVNPSGGTGAYTYSWSNGATTASATGLAAGSYTVTIRDANNCSITRNFTITEPTLIVLNTSSTNASCGMSNGSVSVSASGGTGAYTYSWNTTPAQTTATTTSTLPAGSYNVTVTDANGCTKTATATISNTAAPTASTSVTNVLCFGASTGTATVSVSGAAGPYTYSWNTTPVQTTATATGLAAGTYNVSVTAGNGCIATSSVTITQPTAALTATTSQTNVTCSGLTNGSAGVTASGGTGAYTYSWNTSPVQTTATATGLGAGSYNVTITDANGCQITRSFTITSQPAITLSTSTTNASCGGSNGTATATASGGTGTLTYSWNSTPSQSAVTATGLSAGAYNVTVTDANGCSQTAAATVNNNAAPTASISASTNVSCFGGSNGSATASASGGTGALTYSWNTTPSQTTATATGLVAGTYAVTVNDAAGCNASATVIITQPTQLTASASGSNPLCNGASTGSATVTPGGGTTAYTYSWNSTPSQTSATATNLAAGTYSVTVTDNKGCTATAGVVLTQPTAIIASATQDSVSCFGLSTGSAIASASGGTGTLTYSWSPSGITSATATGLAAGAYTVTVSDANGCSTTASTTVLQPVALGTSTSTTPVACNGGTTGTATVTVTGGTPTYQYSWSSGATTATAGSLAAGTYPVTVTDANGCILSTSATVSQPSAIVLSTSTTASSCGQANASATATASGGTGTLTYSWNTTPSQTTATATNIAAGTYSITVTDGNSCIQTAQAIVSNTSGGTASATSTNVSCFGGSNGTATASMTGGTAPFTYSWNTTPSQTTAIATGLAQGTYSVTITDNVGCQSSAAAIITQPAQLTISSTPTAAACFGASSGSATSTAAGGTGTYTYSWSTTPSQATANATGLAAGTYSVTVTDANACTASAQAIITQPLVITPSTSTVSQNCVAGNGSATASATGGTGAFTYSWNTTPSQATATASNLTSGTYSVTITDANACSVATTAVVGTIPGGNASTTTINVSCNGAADGSATVSMSGAATPPYTYSWNTTPSQTTATASGLIAGTYSVTVTDSYGCIATAGAIITQPAILTASTTKTDVTCFGGSNGSADVTVTGGTAPYTYSWSNGPTSSTNPGLSAGSQTVIVTDAHGCIKSATVNISEPTAITITETAHTDATCSQSNGASTVSASGGAGGTYTYSWSPGPYSGATVNNLPANTYIVTATDQAGCTSTLPVTIQNLSGPSVTTTKTNVSCFGGNNGSATVTATGGLAPYTYSWSTAPAQTNPSATNLTAGIYTIIVTDNTGCSASTSVTITQPNALALNTSSQNPLCFGGCNGTASVTVSGGVSPYTYSWTSSATTATASSLCAGTYTVVVTDSNACTANAPVILTNPLQFSVSTTTINASCQGTCDGQATAVTANGTSPYTYSWTGGQTTPAATQLCAGTYSLSVTDNNSCTAQATAIITQPVALTASIPTSGNVSCFGGSNGYANAIGAGGTAPYTYSWSPGGYTTPSPSGLATGSYTVTISDSKGCSAMAQIFISQPQALMATTTKTNATCYGVCNGTATANVTGGTAPYTYLWAPGGQSTATANNLCAGNYSLNLTDANGCTVVNSVTITQPSLLAVTTSVVNSNCQQNNGKACASIAGGVPPYTYQWNDPALQTTGCATNLFATSYMVTITDANGCSAQAPANVNDIQGPTVAIVSSTNITCYGDSNGTALASINGGVAPFSIAWTPTGPTSTFANNLAQGWHSITVTDSAGCVGSASQFISQPAAITGFITSVNPSCFGSCNGSATINANGGTGTLTYLWNSSPTQTTQLASNLCAGNYTVTVTDSNNCQAMFSKILTQPQQLVLGTATITNVSCNGLSDGVININPSGGTPAYNVQWTPAVGSGNQISGVQAGNYTATITDVKGCTDVMTYTVNQPQPVVVSTTLDPGTCSANNGSVMAQAGGGNPPFSFVWNDPLSQSNDTASNLYAGSYIVIATDTKGCTGRDTILLYDIPGPTIDSVGVVNVSCYNTATGSATVYPKGGTLPYTYLWNDPSTQNTATASSLNDGTYGITVTDANGCVVTNTATITEPPLLSMLETSDTTICYGQAAISLYSTAAGGTPAYTYSWSNAYTNAGPNNVQPLTTTAYYIQVTDNKGCIAKDTINVTVRPQLMVTGPDHTICSGDTVTVTTSSMGGVSSGYTYTWNPAVTTQPSFSPSPNLTSTTTYIVTLNDGCSSPAKDTIVVNVNPRPFVSIDPVSNICVPASVSFSATTDIGASFDWSIPGVDTSANATPTFTFNTAGSYDVTVTVTSAMGCPTTVTEISHITIYPKPIASFTTDQSTTTIVNPIIQFTDQSIDASQWLWNFGDEDTSIVQNPSHTYQDTGTFNVQLIVTSQYGCIDDTVIAIVVEPDFAIYVPNAFSPNGDLVNDKFGPVGLGINPDNFKMYIFDRWGNLLYQATSLDRPWDGKANNGSQPAQEDVYIWKIEAESIKGDKINRTGTVSLVK